MQLESMARVNGYSSLGPHQFCSCMEDFQFLPIEHPVPEYLCGSQLRMDNPPSSPLSNFPYYSGLEKQAINTANQLVNVIEVLGNDIFPQAPRYPRHCCCHALHARERGPLERTPSLERTILSITDLSGEERGAPF